jgi:hypothetical protein
LITPLGSADTVVDELGDDAPLMAGGSLLKFEALVVDGLAVSVDAKVKSDCFHLNLELCVRDMDSRCAVLNCFRYS